MNGDVEVSSVSCPLCTRISYGICIIYLAGSFYFTLLNRFRLS